MQNFYEILIACVACLLVFSISHFLWLWRSKKKKIASMPVFWERIFFALIVVYIASQISPENHETFSLWVVFFYLVFLFCHTWFICRKTIDTTSKDFFKDRNHNHEPGK
ncbi:MAG: hypothetical protein HUU50_04045 [Candidatus Brocadiae bacterium]|nr:hypothetical protein [Candidatus Brocadiia bacterium]